MARMSQRTREALGLNLKKSWQRLFVERCEYEGRLAMLRKRRAEIENETGLTAGQALSRACREFGYISKEDELVRRIDREAHILEMRQTEMIVEERKKEEKEKSRAKVLEANKKFETAVLGLAIESEFKDDIKWVRSHPAMMRKARGIVDYESGRVMVTADDVKDAPSRGAAMALQNFANNPDKFYDDMFKMASKLPPGRPSTKTTEEKGEKEEKTQAEKLIEEYGDEAE